MAIATTTTKAQLLPQHYSNCCQDRGLKPDWVLANCRSIDKAEASRLLGYPAKSGGILFEGVTSQIQFKPTQPWKSKGQDRAPKYRSPASKEYDCWLPQHPTDPDFWETDKLKESAFKIDGKPYLIATEGGFKALSPTSHGYPTIALLGVEMGLRGKDSNGRRAIVPTLQKYVDEGFGFVIAFDADCNTNPNVLAAQTSLIEAIEFCNKDNPIRIATGLWSADEGKGIDDLIQNHGADRFEEILNGSMPIDDYRRQLEKVLEETTKDKTDKLPPPSILAAEITEQYRDKLAYDANSQRWFSYELENTGQWTPVSDEFADSIFQGIIESKVEAFNFGFVSNVKKLTRGKLIVRKWEERSAKELLPFQNGVLEIATGKLLPHSPGYRFTWQLPRQHNVLAADWANIDNFLEEATGGNRAIRNILESFGNALLKGRSDLQRFLFLIGEGGTGKGSFMRLMTELVGQENVHSSTLIDFCGNQFESANALQKRAVFFWDEDRKVGNLGKFKSLTGGDWLRGEEKGRKAFQFKFDGMVAISANFPIFAGDSSSGLSRRVITVPFNNRIPKSQRKNLDQLFEKELDAFTNYLLKLDDDFVTSTLLGLEDIPICTYEFWENRQRTDSIASWLNDWVIFDEYGETPIGNRQNETEIQYEATTLYSSYALHCRQTGTSPKSSKNFSPDLVELCNSILGMSIEKVHTKTGKYLKGVRLRTLADDNNPTYDYALLDRVTNPGDGSVTGGDGSGDGSVTGQVTGQDSRPVSVLGISGIEVTGKVGVEKKFENLPCDDHMTMQNSTFLNGVAIDPSPHLETLQGEGFDPSPHPSPDPSPQIKDYGGLTKEITPQVEVVPSFRVGDEVAGSDECLSSYNWHGVVKAIEPDGRLVVFWRERQNHEKPAVRKNPCLRHFQTALRRVSLDGNFR